MVVEVGLELQSQLVVIVELGKVVGLGYQLVVVVPVLVVGMELVAVVPVLVVGMELERVSLQLGAVVEEVVVGSIDGRIVGNRLARQLERRMELGSTRLGLGPMVPR
jgi:hypothetical protein